MDRLGVGKVNALLDVLLQLGNGGLQQLLLVVVELGQAEVLLDAVLAQHQGCGEEGSLRDGGLHVGALDNVLLAVQSLQQGAGETGTSVGHRQSGGTGSGLGLNDLSTGLLDAHGQLLDGVLVALEQGLALGEHRQDGHAGVAADHGDLHGLGIHTKGMADEGTGTHHIQGGDSEQTLGIVNTSLKKGMESGIRITSSHNVSYLLENLGSDWHAGVHRVGDDGH